METVLHRQKTTRLRRAEIFLLYNFFYNLKINFNRKRNIFLIILF